MPGDARQVIARAASGDDREGLEIADDILATLAAHGLRIVGDGQAVIAGEVVTLREVRGRAGSVQPIAYRRGRWVLGNESDCWMDQRMAYVVSTPSPEEAPDAG